MKKVLKVIRRKISILLVRKLFVHWLNPLYTIYFNFVFFPFKQALRFPVFIYGWPRLYSQFGKMECVGKCETGMIRINGTICGGPQYAAGNTEFNVWGKIVFRGTCEIGTGNRINIGENGILDLGDGTKISSFCNVTVYQLVEIGSQSRVTHRCQLFDTNFHYIADFNKHIVKRLATPIKIGNYCWICNTTTVTGGAVIPDKTIVASNSLVGKDFMGIPSESIIGGIPAKLISSGFRRIESKKLEMELNDYFCLNPNNTTYLLSSDISHSCCDVD